MPAPRCPPIHKPPADWEKWIEKYLVYANRDSFPVELRTFDEFNKNPRFRYVAKTKVDRAWKYHAYYQLSGRKHRTLTI